MMERTPATQNLRALAVCALAGLVLFAGAALAGRVPPVGTPDPPR
ncbi:MAG: hypothetical protein JWM15_140, partial [Cryptosporangiaceae bacterium]|nr:hypothetical protein [Cryptosporangiaceae bacterium]